MHGSRRIVLRPRQRAELERLARKSTDAAWRTRALVVLRSADGWSRPRIAEALSCSVSLVSRVRRRWFEEGLAGLVDRREDNGDEKVTEAYASIVLWILEGTPRDFGHRRPTWTQMLLIDVAARYTGVRVSTTTMSRLL
jgi:transposase